MSETDSFINEVSEEVRRDRMFALWRRYGPFVIGAVVMIVAAAGGKAWWDAQEQAAAERAGGQLLAASEGDLAAQAQALGDIAAGSDHDGARVLASLRAAGVMALDGDGPGAAEAYDRIAADAGADPLIQDFAAFRAVMLRGVDMAPAAFADALSPLANGTGAFRLLALEARGVALLRAGETETGVEELRAVYVDEGAPQTMRQRIEAIATAMGVTLDET